MRLKIRTKIILSFFAPIIPLTVIVVIVSVYLLNNLYNEAQRLDEISKERIKVTDLILLLDRGLMPVNDYIITGDRRYADDFNDIVKEIEERFKVVEDVARTSKEKKILKDVNGAWQNIREISLKIFAISNPVGNEDAGRLIEEMDYKWGYPAIERLKRWREIDLKEYKDTLERHNMAWKQTWITMSVSIILFLVICLIYILFYSKIAVRNEEELRGKEERYRVLLNAVPDIIFRLSKDSIFLDFKGEERELYVSPDKFIGKNIFDVLPQEVAQQSAHFMEQAIKTGDIQTFEYKLPMPEGIKDYEARLAAEEDGFIVIARDITERKKAEKKIAGQIDELERFQNVAVEREFRIKELRNEIQGLKLKIEEMKNK